MKIRARTPVVHPIDGTNPLGPLTGASGYRNGSDSDMLKLLAISAPAPTHPRTSPGKQDQVTRQDTVPGRTFAPPEANRRAWHASVRPPAGRGDCHHHRQPAAPPEAATSANPLPTEATAVASRIASPKSAAAHVIARDGGEYIVAREGFVKRWGPIFTGGNHRSFLLGLQLMSQQPVNRLR